jgi:hypothetical protein
MSQLYRLQRGTGEVRLAESDGNEGGGHEEGSMTHRRVAIPEVGGAPAGVVSRTHA